MEFFEGGRVARFAVSAARRIVVLDSAVELRDLAMLRSNRSEALRGDRAGQYSIRINAQWRICFSGWRTDHTMSRSLTTTDEVNTTPADKMAPAHPGEVLREEMDERDLSANALAQALGIPTNRITALLNGQRGVTADTARRLSQYMGTSSEFWLNLQKAWDLRRDGCGQAFGRGRVVRRQCR